MSRSLAIRSCRLIVRGKQQMLRRGGHGDRPGPPTFQRLPPPTSKMHEESELLWDDGVAPELALDFDAQNYSKWTGFAMWLGGLGFFVSVASFIHFVWDPPSRKPHGPRELPYNNLSEELGGYVPPRPRQN